MKIMIKEQTRQTIENITTDLINANHKLNQAITESSGGVDTFAMETDRELLRKVAKQNRKTLLLIHELELKGAI